ncbi:MULTISPECIES: hypothetical protein [unclassified Methylococcus]|uniref:hypothetical protein n=1 Tax=unclassified Methylococcus TaxID=2618889 RepID=UPI003D7CCFC0
MSDETRSLFIRLNKTEADKVRTLARENKLSMEVVIGRMVTTVLQELEAEEQAAERLPAAERKRMAYDEAVREIEQGWRPEF